MAKRIVREDIDRWYEYGINIPTRTLYVGSARHSEEDGESGMDANLAENTLKGLHILEMLNNEPINIILNNPGGEVYQGLALYDAIINCKSHVTITVYGQACSAAAFLLQAGDKRILSKNSRVMIHYGSEGHPDDHPKVVRAWSKQYEKDEKVMEDILFCRMKEVRTDLTIEELRDMLDFDTIFEPEDAIKNGLADEILGE
jgi:ATP-dependent Clp protease protease subunit